MELTRSPLAVKNPADEAEAAQMALLGEHKEDVDVALSIFLGNAKSVTLRPKKICKK